MKFYIKKLELKQYSELLAEGCNPVTEPLDYQLSNMVYNYLVINSQQKIIGIKPAKP